MTARVPHSVIGLQPSGGATNTAAGTVTQISQIAVP